MRLTAPPARAAWRHHTVREAVEVVTLSSSGSGTRLQGAVTGVEAGLGWSTTYVVDVDPRWRTRGAEVRSPLTDDVVRLELQESGRWYVDGRPRPDLDGCVDVDLEASATTNTLPVHRLVLDVAREVPAAYVRTDLSVERLEQVYGPVEPTADGWLVDYAAPAFEVRCRLALDASGLVLDYPDLARRLL